MMKAATATLCFFISAFAANAQTTLTGNAATINLAVNAPAITVDNSISVTSSMAIDGALVSVSNNPGTGDVLSYSGTLPSGVTANFNATTAVLRFTGVATAAAYQQLLRTVQFSTSSTNVADRTISFNLGTALPFSGSDHFYEFVPGSFTWITAKANAASRSLYGMTGYLATITSVAENNFIQQKLSADGWIGASDDYLQVNAAKGTNTFANQAGCEGRWHWVTGPEAGSQFSNNNTMPTQLTYMNWNSGEPNNSGMNENFGLIYSSGSVPGKWNDLGPTNTSGYVVEYGGSTSDPLVSLVHRKNIKLISTSLQNSVTGNAYLLHAQAVHVDPSMNVYSSASITDAKVTISSGFQTGDVLAVTTTMPSGVTFSYNASTAVMTFTGTATPAQWQTIFRGITYTSTSNNIGNRVVTFSVGNVVAGSNGHFYQFVSSTQDFANANTLANASTYLGLRGYLATITSAEENEFIRQKLSANGWIGLSDRDTWINTAAGYTKYASQTAAEGRWHWVTGPEAGLQVTTGNAPNGTSLPPVFGSSYNNWNAGEPNNSSMLEHYGQFYGTGPTPGKWNDLNGSNTQGYVVEYGGMPTDPLVSLSGNRTMVIAAVLASNGLMISAEADRNHVDIKWSTQSETNTKSFEVMHSVDGSSFKALTLVNAGGNTTTTRNYSFKHLTPAQGANYYRIKTIDADGSHELSATRVVKILVEALSIFPNPVDDQFTIFNPFKSVATMSLKTLGGTEVKQKRIGAGRSMIDASGLRPGVYLVTVYDDNGESQTTRLIKK